MVARAYPISLYRQLALLLFLFFSPLHKHEQWNQVISIFLRMRLLVTLFCECLWEEACSPVFLLWLSAFDLPSLTPDKSAPIVAIHYHCIFHPLSQESLAHTNHSPFNSQLKKENITVLGQDLSKLFSILQILIFKVTMAKGFSGKRYQDKTLACPLPARICPFLSPLLWERTLFQSSLTKHHSDLLNFLMKMLFVFLPLSPQCPHHAMNVLLEIWGRSDSRRPTTKLLTRSIILCSELTHFLSSLLPSRTIPSSLWLISEWPRWFKCGVFFFFNLNHFESLYWI